MSRRRDEPIPPPPGLSERTLPIWIAEAGLRTKSPGRLALLEVALRSLDEADKLHALVVSEGLVTVTKTTGTAHINPLTKLEYVHRTQFVKLAKMLSLDWDGGVDGREW